jgi:hypothetical protein
MHKLMAHKGKHCMSVKTTLLIATMAMTLASAVAQAEEQFAYGGVKIDVAVSPTYASCI